MPRRRRDASSPGPSTSRKKTKRSNDYDHSLNAAAKAIFEHPSSYYIFMLDLNNHECTDGDHAMPVAYHRPYENPTWERGDHPELMWKGSLIGIKTEQNETLDPDTPEYTKALRKVHVVEIRRCPDRATEEHNERESIVIKGYAMQHPENLKDKVTAGQNRILHMLGTLELVRISDEPEYHVGETIDGVIQTTAIDFDDTERNVTPIPEGGWFYRFEIRDQDLKRIHPAAQCSQACDFEGHYNPEDHLQSFCLECNCWYHHTCMTELAGEERVEGYAFSENNSDGPARGPNDLIYHIINTRLTRGPLENPALSYTVQLTGWDCIRSYCKELHEAGKLEFPPRWWAVEPQSKAFEKAVCWRWEGVYQRWVYRGGKSAVADMVQGWADDTLEYLKTLRRNEVRFRCPKGHKF